VSLRVLEMSCRKSRGRRGLYCLSAEADAGVGADSD